MTSELRIATWRLIALYLLLFGNASLIAFHSGELAWRDDVTNGQHPLELLNLGCFVVGPCFAIAGLFLVLVRMVLGRWMERLAWLAVLGLFLLLWFFVAGQATATRFEAGFLQWSRQVNAGPVLAWRSRSVSLSSPVVPYHAWWAVGSDKAPLGISAPPTALRTLLSGPLPEEVRVDPGTGTILMGWRSSLSGSRYLAICPTSGTPPQGFNEFLVRWKEIQPGVWAAVQVGR